MIVLISVTFTACSENEKAQLTQFLGCNELSENYKIYSGENIECQFHYHLTEFNNQQFIELYSHCADLTRPHVINENCIDICENLPFDEDSECRKYMDGREIIEVVLIEK